MSRPVIGVTSNLMMINDTYRVQAAGERNVLALSQAAGCAPVILPSTAGALSVDEAFAMIDGLLLTGARPNVHPSHYGEAETEGHGPFDLDRDALTLPLIRACVKAGKPVFGVCRGIQELAVAFGGKLHPEIRDLPGKANHRMPPGCTDIDVIFRLRHAVMLTPGGWFARTLGRERIVTNSLHGQAVTEPGEGLVVEGVAPDGVIEAISMPSAPGLVIGVQWHAEFDPETDAVNGALFRAFGEAARAQFERRSAA